MWILNGEIDFQARHVSLGSFTLFKEGEKAGDYQVLMGVDSRPNCFTPNHYPRQSNAHLDYDPDRANALLDEAGYTERDGEGFRVHMDGSGETIFFVMESYTPAGDPGEDAAQMAVKYFADVGKCAYEYVERSLYEEHGYANAFDAVWWCWNNRTVLPTTDLNNVSVFIGTNFEVPWAGAYGLWYHDPNDPNGEEPPPDHFVRDLWAYWDRISVEPDEEQRHAIFTEIMDIWAEELPQIGYLGLSPLIIEKNGFHNYLPGYPVDSPLNGEHLLSTQTYFWEEPEEHA